MLIGICIINISSFISEFYVKPSLSVLISIAVFAFLVCVFGLIGLQLQSAQLGVTPFWPVSGFVFFVLFIRGFYLWPGVVIGMMLLALHIDIPLTVAFVTGVTAVLEAVIPIIIVRRYNFSGRLNSLSDCLLFGAIVLLAPIISAVVGSSIMLSLSMIPALPAFSVMMLWWLGNSIGLLLLGGTLLSIHESIELKNTFILLSEKVIFILLSIIIFLFVYTQQHGIQSVLLANFLIPLIFIGAVRFGAFGALAPSLILTVLMSVFIAYQPEAMSEHKPFGYQYLILVEFWFVSLSGLLISGAFRDRVMMSRLQWLAHHDALTKLSNRTLIQQEIEMALKGMRKTDNDVCLLFIDVDNLKPINDELGHTAGDELLVQVSQVLKDTVRQEDIVSRWGGDEFIILLRQCPEKQTKEVAEKILKSVKELTFKTQNKTFNVTVSIGLACAILGDSKTSFIERADAACYESKNQGRNKITVDVM